MSFFDEFTQKARDVAGTAAEKAREVAGSAKISAAILSEKRELNKRYREIGQWYASEHAGGDVPEAIADVMNAVRESQDKITALQAEREQAETEEALAEEDGKTCPVCGRVSADKFCPNCGRPLEE